MPAPLPEALEKKLAARLRYYEDLGIHQFYKYHVVAASVADAIAEAPAVVQLSPAAPKIFHEEPPLPKQTPRPQPVGPGFGLASSTAPSAPVLPPRAAGPSLFDAVNKIAGDTLLKVREDLGDCTRCKLHKTRKNIVFADGNPKAELVFVGEGPGADEDAQGLPFVGRAGQLLTQMIDGTASKEGIPISRPDVYICNVVKCRPPENRTPLPEEMEMCGQFLFRQLMALRPKAICALGSTAAKALLATKDGVTRLRGNWHKWHDIPVMVTYHPSYLLRPYNQNAKREAWDDLKKVLHFVYD